VDRQLLDAQVAGDQRRVLRQAMAGSDERYQLLVEERNEIEPRVRGGIGNDGELVAPFEQRVHAVSGRVGDELRADVGQPAPDDADGCREPGQRQRGIRSDPQAPAARGDERSTDASADASRARTSRATSIISVPASVGTMPFGVR
jgi:hypothetical protein